MGFTQIVRRPHVCSKPWLWRFLAGYGPGTRWQCDECGQGWVLCLEYTSTVWEKDDFDMVDGAGRPIRGGV
jgi:hypothetical protein